MKRHFDMITAAQLVKKFPVFYGTHKAHYHVHNNLPLVPILNQRIQTTPSHLCPCLQVTSFLQMRAYFANTYDITIIQCD